MRAILYAPEEARAELIAIALSQKDPRVQREAAEAILQAPKNEQHSLRLLVLEKIKQGLSQEDPKVQGEAT